MLEILGGGGNNHPTFHQSQDLFWIQSNKVDCFPQVYSTGAGSNWTEAELVTYLPCSCCLYL